MSPRAMPKANGRRWRASDETIRLVCVDHLATQVCGRGLYRVLAGTGAVRLTVVIPVRWRDNYREIPAEASSPGDRFGLEILPIVFSGKSNRCLHRGLGYVLRRIRPDVVFVQSEPEDLLLSQVLLIRAAYRLDFKIIFITWRNIHYSRFGIPYKFAWVYGCTEYLGLRYSDHCFAFNAGGSETLNARGFGAIDVVPPAIDTTFFRPRNGGRVRRALGLDGFTIGFFGRFVEEKGVGLLLEAVAGLEHPVQVLLVGDGPAREAWMEQAKRLGIQDRVVHKPSVLRSDVPEHICACDMVVLPSYATAQWKEQFGRILIEAMACGVPVVGSDSGEIPAVIGDAGLIFPEKDVAALGRCVRRMIEESGLRERLAQEGRRRARTKYSCTAVAAAWLDALRRLVGEQRAKRARSCGFRCAPDNSTADVAYEHA